MLYATTTMDSQGDSITVSGYLETRSRQADEYLLPPEYHETAQAGEAPVLSYRVFGTDVDRELDDPGFDVAFSMQSSWKQAVFDTELFTCRRRSR